MDSTTSNAVVASLPVINGEKIYNEIMKEVREVEKLKKEILKAENTRRKPTCVVDTLSRNKSCLLFSKYRLEILFRILDKVVPNVSSIRIEDLTDGKGKTKDLTDEQLLAAVKTGRELEKALSKSVPTKKARARKKKL